MSNSENSRGVGRFQSSSRQPDRRRDDPRDRRDNRNERDYGRRDDHSRDFRRDNRDRDYRRDDRRDDRRERGFREKRDERRFDDRRDDRRYRDDNRDSRRDFREDRRGDRRPGGRPDFRRESTRRNQVIEYSPPPPDIVPLHLRPKKLNNWDVRPVGYEDIPAEQAKATGAFLLPCHLLKGTGQFGNVTINPGFGYGPAGLMIEGLMPTNPVNPRQQRRLYVGNLPEGTTEQELVDFVSAEFEKLGVPKEAGNACVSAHINAEKSYALVEFRNPEEATEGMALNNVKFKDVELSVLRPKDYNSTGGSGAGALIIPGVGNAQDNPNMIVVRGLPSYLSDDQIKDLLEAFGPLKTFKLIRDPITNVSRGYAVCEYVDAALTDIACEGLHGLELGDSKLVMQKANSIPTQELSGPLPLAAPILPIEILGQAGLKPGKPTSILLLLNMLLPDELLDDDEYKDIVRDIKEECEELGEVVEIAIPRPLEEAEIPGVGKVFNSKVWFLSNMQHPTKQQRPKGI